jgi:hypothetical protein
MDAGYCRNATVIISYSGLPKLFRNREQRSFMIREDQIQIGLQGDQLNPGTRTVA